MYLSNEKKGYHKQNLIDRKGIIFFKRSTLPHTKRVSARQNGGLREKIPANVALQ